MKLRLVAFDIDGTLTSFNEPVDSDVSMVIRHLEDVGIRIALSSGRDLIYLERVVQELGVKRPIIIAENGCAIVDVVGGREVWLAKRIPELYEIRKRLRSRFSDALWEQPNEVELTLSAKISALQSEVISYAEEIISHHAGKVHAYVSAGCIDILPFGISKGAGLAEVKKMYALKRGEVAAIGDGENDIPMFEEAGLPLIVGSKVSFPSALRFSAIGDALDFLSKYVNGG